MDQVMLPPFTVTSAAISQIASLGGAVVVDIEEGGCCGLAYTYKVINPDITVGTATERYGCPGAWLLVSTRAQDLLPGATLDYSDRIGPPRFRVIRNPNTPDVCACRRSFGKPWPGPGQTACCSYRPMPWDDQYDPPAAWKRQTGYSD